MGTEAVTLWERSRDKKRPGRREAETGPRKDRKNERKGRAAEERDEIGKRIKNQGKESVGTQQCSLQCDLRQSSALNVI